MAMKYLRTIGFLVLCLGTMSVSAQGTWKSILELGNLPLNLRQEAVGDSMTWVLYSPSQTETAYAASSYRWKGDTLNIFIKKLNCSMSMKYDSASRVFSGTFQQHFISRCAITFEPTDGLWTFARPQTPTPPFPYSIREVRIPHKAGKKETVTLAGTLTVPEGEGPFPAVVLVSGSGPQNRDEELMMHKPFAVLADYLTRRGIAVLRYDDRGVGESSGDYGTATTLDFAKDAEAVFDFLRKQKGIDAKKVGILGHSEGGIIAPIVASRNKKVGFVVLMAGTGGTGGECLLEQNQRLFELKGVSERLVEVRLACMRDIFAIVQREKAEQWEGLFEKAIVQHTQGLTKAEKDSIEMRESMAVLWAEQLQNPWMREFIALDARKYLARVKCPILALNGSRDIQVVPSNLEKISMVTDGRADTLLMPGLNHLFQHCETGNTSEYLFIEETLSPEFMEVVGEWIKRW